MSRPAFRCAFAMGALAALLALLCACSSLQVFGKEDSEERARQLDRVQLRVMQFADEYVGEIIGPLNAIQARAQDPQERLDAQNWKVSQATAAYANASAPNPVNGALDIIVLATLSRMVVQEEVTSSSGRLRSAELQAAHEKVESRAWELSTALLNEQQKEQLRNSIKAWRAANPDMRAVALVHYADLPQAQVTSEKKNFMSRGLFGLIGIEPLGGLDPAVREIAQTRQLAQRAIYYAQRTPALLDMQVERLTYQLVLMPESRRLLTDVDRAADAAQRAGRLADALPTVIAQEREAAITQIMSQLSAQQSTTRALIRDLHELLDAGAVTSDSVNTTIQSLDALIARFHAPGTSTTPASASGQTARSASNTEHPHETPSPPSAEANVVADYTHALAQLTSASRELQRLIVTLDNSTGGVERLVGAASANAKHVVDYVVLRLIILALAIAVISVAAVLAYKIVANRVTS